METIKHNGTATIVSNTEEVLKVVAEAREVDIKTLVLLIEKINADLHDIWARLDLMVH